MKGGGDCSSNDFLGVAAGDGIRHLPSGPALITVGK